MTPGSGTVVDARTSLAMWLREGRARKKLSLDDVARITKIQARILDKLESGQLDGLPAEVFVKGFVKSFARCVGLDEGEALDRYTQCKSEPPMPSMARALVETMAELAPLTAKVVRPIDAPIEVIEVVEVAPPIEVLPVAEAPKIETAPVEVAVEAPVEVAAEAPVEKKPKRTRKKAVNADGTPKAPRARKKKSAAVIEMVAEEPLPTESTVPTSTIEFALVDTTITAEGSGPTETTETTPPAETTTWTPTMPPLATTSSAPWRRPSLPMPSVPSVPSLVIDDADPDRAEREQDERASAHRVSFLPPILLDREDRSARQGGLTLAVIILLIAATLTLSYLMRRPSVSGNGVTIREVPASLA
jgi:hypothetical protein